MADKKKFEGIKAVTPTFRASYLNVFEPKAIRDDAPEKFSVQMIFDKKRTDLTELKKKMKSIAVAAWGKDEKKWPKNFRWPFKDGDQTSGDMEEKQAAIYAGQLYCNADSKNQPGIYDQDKNDILDKREFFSGCYARASLFMVPYENVGGKGADGRSGIKLYLQGIQLVKKGEKLGGGDSRGDFETIENEEGGGSAAEGEDDEDPGF